MGPSGTRRGLRSLSPKWPSPSRPPSPTGASLDKPIILTDESAPAQDIVTPTVPEPTNRRLFLLPRKSLRIQAQVGPETVLTKAKKRARENGEGSSSTNTGNPLVINFPFRRLTIEQVVELFKVYHIQIGSNDETRVQLISAIQHMDRASFETVITDLMHRTKSVSQNQLVVVDSLDSLAVHTASGVPFGSQ